MIYKGDKLRDEIDLETERGWGRREKEEGRERKSEREREKKKE